MGVLSGGSSATGSVSSSFLGLAIWFSWSSRKRLLKQFFLSCESKPRDAV